MLTPVQYQKARLSKDPRFDGLFFVLVQSTGIFCRPICKVRAPKEENVSYAHSAIEAMQRGYRPCLRCRPDSAPGSFAWKGIETSVQRAIGLIREDPSQSIQVISTRLGISSRYLHKIFMQHLGIAPKQYLLFQQLLMAKNLLHQTTMSVETVAQNVGFTNARQLQLHCKKHLKLTPQQIRNRPMITESDKISVYLPYNPPYRWDLLRDFLRFRQIDGNEDITDDGMRKTLTIGNESVPIQVFHQADNNRFELQFDVLNSKHSQKIINKVKTLLDLNVLPLIVDDALRESNLETPSIISGLRIPGVTSRLEAGCRAILGQQVSLKQAVVKLNQLHVNLSDGAAFPSASSIARSDLEFLKMPGARKQALRELADAFSQEPALNTEDLLQIKGIGPWTCNYIAMRTHESTDIWLENDLIIKQRVEMIKQNCPDFVPENAAPWRSYLTMNLWHMNE